MHEILKNQPQGNLSQKFDYLIDTCFLVWAFEQQLSHKLAILLANHSCAITSFNLEELQHIKVSANIKQQIKHFFKEHTITLLTLPVHPGNYENERTFVEEIAPNLVGVEKDMSDAVLLAAAIKTQSNILTRDKHDIFNTKLENHLQKHAISVSNTFPKEDL